MTVRDSARNAHELGPDTYRAAGWHALVGRLLEELDHADQAPSSCGQVDDEQRARLLRVWSSGAQTSVASMLLASGNSGVPPSAAIGYARRYCAILLEDPAVREEITHDLAHQWLGHEGKPVRLVMGHHLHRPGQDGP